MNRIRFIVVVAILSCAFFYADFEARLAKGDMEFATLDSLQKVNSPEVRLLDDRNKQEIQALLNNYDVIEKKPVDSVKQPAKALPNVFIMDETQQAKQKGNLLDLYAGNTRYRLVATFNDNGRKFALVLKQDLASGKSEKIQLTKGDSLSGYFLTKITDRAIQVELDGRVIQLQLFQYKQSNV